MATRFYLPSTGAADVSPAHDGSWTYTSDADRRKTVTVKIGSALANKTFTKTSAVGGENAAARMYVSDPLSGAQTITGTVKGQILAMEDAAAANARAQFGMRVVSNDGTTVRGTLLALTSSTVSSEFSTTLSNRKFPRANISPATLTSVAAQDGDRIVFTLGAMFNESSNTTRTGTLRFGDVVGTDLPEDETATTDGDPWVELSQTLTFQSGAATVTGASLLTSETTLTAVGLNTALASSLLAADSLLTATALNTTLASTLLTAQSSLTCAADVTTPAPDPTATLTAQSSLSATGSVTVIAAATLESLSSLSAIAANTILASALLTGSGTLSCAATTGTPPAPGTAPVLDAIAFALEGIISFR